jgi:hypothetical protein
MIIVIEPQCFGIEHADVNAALLNTIRTAFPSRPVFFFAESEHLTLVQKISSEYNGNTVEYKIIKPPNRFFSNIHRLPAEWKLTKHIFFTADKLGCKKIVFASVTSPGLWCIKFFIRKFKNIYVFIIPHGILETVIKPPLNKPWQFVFWFRFSLLFWNLPRLKYLLFGVFNLKELNNLFPKIHDYICSIDLPYFFVNNYTSQIMVNTVIKFGSFGFGQKRKGTDIFFNLATDIHSRTSKCLSEFILVGHISEPELKELITDDVVIPSTDNPLSREKFNEYAYKIDYAIFCFNKDSYRLTVSGSFYDAIAYCKPIIALRTPFFEHYFSELGDIGYLCDDYDQMLVVILNIIEERPTQRYQIQLNNLITGREKLGIKSLSLRLRELIE